CATILSQNSKTAHRPEAAHLGRGTTEPSGQYCATVPDPRGLIRPRHGHRPSVSSWTGAVEESPRGCPPAEPVPNGDRSLEREPSGLNGRRGGTKEFLERGATPRSRRAALGASGADPWIRVWCSFVLTPRAEASAQSGARRPNDRSSV